MCHTHIHHTAEHLLDSVWIVYDHPQAAIISFCKTSFRDHYLFGYFLTTDQAGHLLALASAGPAKQTEL